MDLVKFDAARTALAEAASVDEVLVIRNKAEALRAYIRQSGESLEMQNRCAEIRIRAERRAGELLTGIEKGRPRKGDTMSPLSKLGVTKKQSSRWQKIASVPEDVLTKHITATFMAEKELTSASVRRLARSLENANRNGAIDKDVTGTLTSLADCGRKFATIYADPPWQYGNQGTRAATDNHYPTMSIEEICGLPVKDVAEERSLLFLWATSGFLVEALTQVIPAWGFTYKSGMVWVKPQMGIGNYVRLSHEYLLIANRGGLRPNGRSQISWVEADRCRHSKKPDLFREIVERISPGPRLEMFAREQHEGWVSWGNQVGPLARRLL